MKGGDIAMELSRLEVMKRVPNLKEGSFVYWVQLKAKIFPVRSIRKKQFFVEQYDESCIEKIKKVMGESNDE